MIYIAEKFSIRADVYLRRNFGGSILVKTHIQNFFRIFSQISVIFVITSLLIVVIEFSARAVVKNMRWGQPIYMLQYTDQNIRKLYNTDQPNLYRSIIAESWRDDMLVYEPFLEFQTRPYSGGQFSVTDDRFRSYPGSPQSLKVDGPRIFVYGGSTTFGMGVSDTETIPYFMQKHLQEAGYRDVRVFNFGVPGYYSTQEMMLFQRHIREGNAPDAAIFIDGLNDFYMCQTPDKSGQSWMIERVLSGSGVHSLGRVISQRSNVMKLLRIYQGREIPGQRDGDPCGSLDDAERVIQRLDSNRRMLAAIGQRLNITTIFVQQPVPTYGYDNSKRPIPLHDKEKFGLHKNSIIGYPIMVKKRESGQLFSDDVLWLENSRIDQNMYIDIVHYSPQFNDKIAMQVTDHLVKNHARKFGAN